VGKAADDLGDRAAVYAEVESRLILLPAENLNGVDDVASGEVVARVFGHDRSFTVIGMREPSALKITPRSAHKKA
jgi:hypothetical protein